MEITTDWLDMHLAMQRTTHPDMWFDNRLGYHEKGYEVFYGADEIKYCMAIYPVRGDVWEVRIAPYPDQYQYLHVRVNSTEEVKILVEGTLAVYRKHARKDS